MKRLIFKIKSAIYTFFDRASCPHIHYVNARVVSSFVDISEYEKECQECGKKKIKWSN